jgi:hypothetical protein
MWLVMKLQKTAKVQLSSTKLMQDVPVSGMADGCIGCLLVFENKEDAIKYAGDEENLLQVGFKE